MAQASESGNLIVYNGAMVDIGSMMQKLEKSEKTREEIEQKLMVQGAKAGTRQFSNVKLFVFGDEMQATLCVSSPSGQ